jgi:hypothetical protein
MWVGCEDPLLFCNPPCIRGRVVILFRVPADFPWGGCFFGVGLVVGVSGYGILADEKKHCMGLLPPGEGKSECFLIPSIARHIANQQSKTIIHVSPYSFLAGYHHANAIATFENMRLLHGLSACFFTGREIKEGHLP